MAKLSSTSGSFDRGFITSLITWLLLVLVFLATLGINGFPIIDHDSQRYLPTVIGAAPFSLSPQRAALMPLLLNEAPFRLFGIMGIPICASLVVAWALTLLLQELARVFVDQPHLRRPFCLYGVMLVAVLSFVPVLAISVLSEPWSVVAFSLVFVVLLSRKISVPMALALLITGASHSTNLIILGSAVLGSAFLSGFAREHLKVSCIVLALFVSGSALDRGLFVYTQGDSPRVRYSFVGAAILNFYPKMYEDFCDQAPSSSLCRQDLKEFIIRNRDPLDYSKSRFLWSPTKICRDLPGASSLPHDAMISLDDYERESAAMMRLIARHPITYMSYIPGVVAKKVVALFSQSHFYSHPYNLSIDSVREPWASSLVVRSINKSAIVLAACTLSRVVVVGTLILMIASIFVHGRSSALSQPQRTALVLAIVIYAANLLMYGSLEAALSRYHYRAYFFIPLIAYALAWRMWSKRN